MAKADLHLHSKYSNHPSEWFLQRLGASESYTENGVSITLRKIRQLAAQKKSDLVVAGSFDSQRDLKEYPQNTLDLPIIFSFQLPGYEQYTLKIPSVLKSLESIYDYKPDEIIISTPGPIGLVGLMAAKLLNIKSVGIYHTDFKLHGLKITKDKSMANFLGSYVKSFYSLQDEILVSSKEYIRILENRGIKSSKMKIFPRGIDTDLFSPNKTEAEEKYKLGFKNGFNLLYSGRISKDKELDFLIEVFSHLSKKTKDINLIITGSGPYFNDLRIKTKEMENIFFTGVVDHKFLHKIYSAADLFVFPSVADTFGMVILEAQSCGLPAIVSDRGGPQEIIIKSTIKLALLPRQVIFQIGLERSCLSKT
jgi:glycosyltransferase involved in cell wall biosynthesis